MTLPRDKDSYFVADSMMLYGVGIFCNGVHMANLNAEVLRKIVSTADPDGRSDIEITVFKTIGSYVWEVDEAGKSRLVFHAVTEAR